MDEKVAIDFTLLDIKNEIMPDRVVYCVKFCDKYPNLWSFFAAVGSNTVSIYCISSGDVNLIRHYVDESIRSNGSDQEADNEVYYACTWASSGIDQPVVVAGGKRGILKVLSTQTELQVGIMHGHGGDIHELKTHPIDDGLVVSASKDLSVRLWNIRSLTCVAIFGGEQGHRRDVLSLDIHTLGNCMVSSSLDTCIKIWNLRSPKLLDVIKRSDEPQPGHKAFKVHLEQIPLYSTTQIHAGYVDSVRWVGDCILSKSTNNRIVLWMPDSYRYKGASTILQEYTLHHGDVWFIKLDVCIPLSIFAVGNTKGKVSVYPLGPEIPERLMYPGRTDDFTKERFLLLKSCSSLTGLQHPRLTAPVRQVSFSAHAKYLVACLDGGFIVTWEVNTRVIQPNRLLQHRSSNEESNEESEDYEDADMQDDLMDEDGYSNLVDNEYLPQQHRLDDTIDKENLFLFENLEEEN